MSLEPVSNLWDYFINFVEEGVAECKLCKQRLKNNRSYNLRNHIQKLHVNRPELDRYYKINLVDKIAVCRICNHRLQNRLCNLKVHMRRVHYIEMTLPEIPLSLAHLNYDEQTQAVLKEAKRKMPDQLTNNSSKRPTHRLFIKMDKKTIVRSVIGLIVEDGMPPDLFSSEHFDAILRPMCESISAKQGKEFQMQEADIETIINSLANTIRNDFSNEISCRLLTIKIDNDLGPWQNVFSVTAMFLDDGQIQKRNLGLIELNDNTELQEDHIKHILYKYNIDSNQIISVCWNNSKSMYNNEVQSSEYLREIESFKSYPELYLGDVQIEPYLGSLAQLCLLDIFNNAKILQPFLECRNLVKYLNDKSNGYITLFDSNKASLPQLDSPWNAGSTDSMMNKLWEARSFLQTIKFETPEAAKDDQFNCNEDLWLFIEAFCTSTSYLQKTILKCYNEELHIGDFYAQWLKCKLLTEKCATDYINSNEFFSSILNELLKSIENITQQLLAKERVMACLYLDPRFQHILDAAQKNVAAEYLKKLWCRSKLYIDDDTAEKNDAGQNFNDDEDAFLNEFLSNDLPVKDKASNEVFQKIDELTLTFQAADSNILSFWKGSRSSDPEIYTLSAICFAIPATEIYTKIHYSHVYPINVESEMSAFTKESLLYLRLNAHLLDTTIAQLQLINEKPSTYSLNSTDNEEDSSEVNEDGNSNAASNLTTGSGDTTKFSTDVSCSEVKIEDFVFNK